MRAGGRITQRAKYNYKIQLLSLLNYQSISLLCIQHFLQILLLTVHNRLRYKNVNIGQTISPWEHLLNFIKDKSQRAHGTS